MKIFHQYITTWNDKQVKKLEKFGVKILKPNQPVNVYEDCGNGLKDYLDNLSIFHVKGVEFSSEELNNAEYSVLNQILLIGYPMPDSNGGYLERTFNTDNYCSECGIGLEQKEAFYIKKVPSKKTKIFSLNWVYDELFVEREYYNEIFKPLGYKFRDVRSSSKPYAIIDSFVQLVIPTIDESLDISGFDYEICNTCHYKKTHPTLTNFFPLQDNPLQTIYKSKEYFGSGASARKKIFLSKKMRDLLIETANLPKEVFWPCK